MIIHRFTGCLTNDSGTLDFQLRQTKRQCGGNKSEQTVIDYTSEPRNTIAVIGSPNHLYFKNCPANCDIYYQRHPA